MQDGVVVLIVSIFMKMQLDDVPELQRLPTDRMLLELLNIWDDVCDVVHSAISCASLQNRTDSNEDSLVTEHM